MATTPEPTPEPSAAESGPAADCAVVVVTWNGAHLLPECLDALVGRSTELVVVDNGSTDGTAGVVRSRYPTVRLITLDTNTGFAAAANRGIEATRAPFVVLVNNDAVCAPGFLPALLAPFTNDPQVGAVTARIVLASRYRLDSSAADGLVDSRGRRWVASADGVELLNSTGAEVTVSGNGRDRDWLTPVGDGSSASDVFGFCGGAAALRRAALDDVGLFDESLFLYYEDTDMSWRLRRRGWSVVYAPDAVARHRHAASSGTRSEFFLWHNERNRLIVAVRQAPFSVVFRAVGHFVVHALRERSIRRHISVAAQVTRRLPRLLRERRAIDARATISRAAVARYLVPDRPGR